MVLVLVLVLVLLLADGDSRTTDDGYTYRGTGIHNEQYASTLMIDVLKIQD
jgi:hypothetical protein